MRYPPYLERDYSFPEFFWVRMHYPRTRIDDVEKAKKKLLEHKEEIIKIANDQDPFLNELGGGAFDFERYLVW